MGVRSAQAAAEAPLLPRIERYDAVREKAVTQQQRRNLLALGGFKERSGVKREAGVKKEEG